MGLNLEWETVELNDGRVQSQADCADSATLLAWNALLVEAMAEERES